MQGANGGHRRDKLDHIRLVRVKEGAEGNEPADSSLQDNFIKRMAFSVVRKKLCTSRAMCSQRYSALLCVVHNNITELKSAAEVERFADSL